MSEQKLLEALPPKLESFISSFALNEQHIISWVHTYLSFIKHVVCRYVTG